MASNGRTESSSTIPDSEDPGDTSSESEGIDMADVSHGPDMYIEDFEVGPRLGSGRFGLVCLARETTSGMTVALKLLARKQEINAVNYDDAFKNEINIQAHLRHENIISLFTWFYDKDYAYMVLEAARGDVMSLLQDKLKSNKHRYGFDERECAVIHRQTISAMAYLHGKHICHRDLKPENLLYTMYFRCDCVDCLLLDPPPGRRTRRTAAGRTVPLHADPIVKLADFGWACHLAAESDHRSTLCGTFEYISPHMASQRKGYSPYANDVWALGILAYELVSGFSPHKEDMNNNRTADPGGDMTRIIARNKRIKYPRSMSPEMKDYLQQMFLDPEEKNRVRLVNAKGRIYDSRWLRKHTHCHPMFFE